MYSNRLGSELKKLRKKYQQETDKSKKEFMHVHSKKVRNWFDISPTYKFVIDF